MVVFRSGFTKDNRCYTGDVEIAQKGVGDLLICFALTASRSFGCTEMSPSCFILKSIIVTKYNKGMKCTLVNRLIKVTICPIVLFTYHRLLLYVFMQNIFWQLGGDKTLVDFHQRDVSRPTRHVHTVTHEPPPRPLMTYNRLTSAAVILVWVRQWSTAFSIYSNSLFRQVSLHLKIW